jgi:hypothetical protein
MFIIFSVNPYEVEPKYNEAIKNARIASYKQSGLESQVTNLANTTGSKVNQWLYKNNLKSVSQVVTVSAPIIIKKEISFQYNNVMFVGNSNKKQLTWTVSF